MLASQTNTQPFSSGLPKLANHHTQVIEHGLKLLACLLQMPDLQSIRAELERAQTELSSGKAVTLSSALGSARHQLLILLPQGVGQNILSLSCESSKGLFGQGLLELSSCFEDRQDLQTAGQLLSMASKALEGVSGFESSYLQALHQMEVLNGGGEIGDQIQMFARSLPHELQNGSMLVGMMAAGLANPLGARVVGRLFGRSLGQGTRLLASNLGGVFADGFAFETASRGVRIMQGQQVGSFTEGLGHAYWMIGNLRVMGLAGKLVSQSSKFNRVVTSIARNQIQRVHKGLHTAFEYGGIYLSQTQGHLVGIEQSPAPYAWMQSAFTLVHFRMAGASLRAIAPGFGSLTQRLQLETAKALQEGASQLGQRIQNWWELGSKDGTTTLQHPLLAMASGQSVQSFPTKGEAFSTKELIEAFAEGKADSSTDRQAPSSAKGNLGAQSPSPTRGFRAVFPSLRLQLEMDPAISRELLELPGWVQKEFSRTQGEDPLFFANNHLRWLGVLLKRDAGVLGPEEALTQGALTVFAGGLKDPLHHSKPSGPSVQLPTNMTNLIGLGAKTKKRPVRSRVREKLQEILKKGSLTLDWQLPSSREWWQPVWDLALEGHWPAQALKMLYDQVAQETPELIQLWEKEMVVLGQTDLAMAVSRASAIPLPSLDITFEKQLRRLPFPKEASSSEVEAFNERLTRFYQQALDRPEPLSILSHVKAIQDHVIGLATGSIQASAEPLIPEAESILATLRRAEQDLPPQETTSPITPVVSPISNSTALGSISPTLRLRLANMASTIGNNLNLAITKKFHEYDPQHGSMTDKTAYTYRMLIQIYQALGRPATAETLKRTLGNNTSVYQNPKEQLGSQQYIERGEYEEALRHIDKLTSPHHQAHQLMALLEKIGLSSQARGVTQARTSPSQQPVGRRPSDHTLIAYSYHLLAYSYTWLGDISLAQEAYSKGEALSQRLKQPFSTNYLNEISDLKNGTWNPATYLRNNQMRRDLLTEANQVDLEDASSRRDFMILRNGQNTSAQMRAYCLALLVSVQIRKSHAFKGLNKMYDVMGDAIGRTQPNQTRLLDHLEAYAAWVTIRKQMKQMPPMNNRLEAQMASLKSSLDAAVAVARGQQVIPDIASHARRASQGYQVFRGNESGLRDSSAMGKVLLLLKTKGVEGVLGLAEEHVEKDAPHKAMATLAELSLWMQEHQISWLQLCHSFTSSAQQTSRPKTSLTIQGGTLDSMSLLPKRSPEEIAAMPPELRELIPQRQNLHLFPRFQRIRDDVASLVAAPVRIPIRLYGPAGTGKTTIIEEVAAEMGAPLLLVPFHERLDPEDTIRGTYTLKKVDGKLKRVFRPGPVALAKKYGLPIVFDERNTAPPNISSSFNNEIEPPEDYFDWITEEGTVERIPIHPNYQPIVTENLASEVGRFATEGDQLRRMVSLFVDDWSLEETTQVSTHMLEQTSLRYPGSLPQTLAAFHTDLRDWAAGRKEDPDPPYAKMDPLGSEIGQEVQFTPRSMERVVKRLADLGAITPTSLSRALRAEYILPLDSPDHRELVWQQANHWFEPIRQTMREGGGIPVLGPRRIPEPTLETISENYLGGTPVSTHPGFVWHGQALRLVDELLWNRKLGIDVILMGDPGQGKSVAPKEIANILGLPFERVTMREDMEAEDLIGRPAQRGDEIVFIPEVVTKVSDPKGKGGVAVYDEFLLTPTGQVEAVFGSLTDYRRSLIIPSPFRKLNRHPDSFFIFSSNPPHGEQGGRYQRSAAAMSRLATIYTSGDFKIGQRDREAMAEGWFNGGVGTNPSLIVPSAKKKALSPMGTNLTSLPTHLNSLNAVPFWLQAASSPPRFVECEVHPTLAEKFDLPSSVTIEISPEGTPIIPEELQGNLFRFGHYLSRYTQMQMGALTDRYIQVNFSYSGSQRTNLVDRSITLNLLDLLRFSYPGARALVKHEYGHGILDHLPPEKHPHWKFFTRNVARYFTNVALDGRINNWVVGLHEDFREEMDGYIEAQIPKDSSLTPQEIALYQQRKLPHEQFGDGVLYYWAHGKIPNIITNPKVIAAIEQALPAIERCFNHMPTSHNEVDTKRASLEAYDFLEEAFPYYQELLKDSLEQIKQRLEQGEIPEGLIIEIQIPISDGKPSQSSGEDSSPSSGPTSPDTKPGTGPSPTSKPGELPPIEPNLDQAIREAIEALEDKEGDKGEPKDDKTQDNGQVGQKPEERLMQLIMEKRAEYLADQLEPLDPTKRAQRKEAIKDAQIQEKNAQDRKGQASPNIQQGPVIRNAPMTKMQLSPAELQRIQREADLALKKQQTQNRGLYQKMLPPGTIAYARKLKNKMPPELNVAWGGRYSHGRPNWKRISRAMARGDLDEGRNMMRRVLPKGHDGNVLLLSDISLSMRGAFDNSLRASATGIAFCEELSLSWGEILFAKEAAFAKRLGVPLRSLPKKNQALEFKRASFSGESLGQGTNISLPFQMALEAIRKRPARANHIILLTDGDANIHTTRKSLAELKQEADRLGVVISELLIGNEVRPNFDRYTRVSSDGRDIPQELLNLMTETHYQRLGR